MCGFKGKTNNYIYKKLQNYLSAVLLGLVMLILILLYASQYIDLYWGGQYYLVRSRIELNYSDDGKSITYYPILFFLYKIDDDDIVSPDGAEAANRFYSNEEVEVFCGSLDKVYFFSTESKA
jgi:hypothetical protein